ncbi:MAG: hypothetical protein D6756_08785 [Cyanobacteria bacterium J083]|nr:MAG: hypothetical protein D6756_08785 [Cyanobacteria bacterium J083]
MRQSLKTLGFAVLDSQAELIAKCVDDLTLQADCQTNTPSKPGWYRIISDDRRLLELIKQQADPEASITEVLKPIATLFATKIQLGEGGMVQVVDKNSAPIAITTPLPGERERPCELITPLLKKDYLVYLKHLLDAAKSLNFTIPQEGATHIHFDASPLADTRIFSNLVNLLASFDILSR